MATQLQARSRLLQLPLAIRQEIYACVFERVDLKFNDGVIAPSRPPLSTSERSALALFRTCRQIEAEIGDTWLDLVCFSFAWPDKMLDVLTPLPMEKRAQICNICTRDAPLMLHTPDEYDEEVGYRLASILKLLPGLKLDKLLIMAGSNGPTQYRTVDELVRLGNGWKGCTSLHLDLRFSDTRRSLVKYQHFMATGMVSEPPIQRQPQPAHWQTILRNRNGTGSNASAAVWRSTFTNCPGSAFGKATSTEFRQTPPNDLVLKMMFGAVEDEDMMSNCERNKDLLIILKRGEGVDYEEKASLPTP